MGVSNEAQLSGGTQEGRVDSGQNGLVGKGVR